MSTGGDKSVWDKLVGGKAEFSMENRAFNVVGLITFFVLIYTFVFDLFIGQDVMCCVIAFLFVVLCVLFYFSRIRKQFRHGLTIYAFCCYGALVTNFFYDGGITGPTLLFFGLMFLMLIAMSSPRLYLLWITLHIGLAAGLLYIGYAYPGLVGDTYETPASRVLDILAGYIALIVFVFFITNYLRRYYHDEKILSDARFLEIVKQNEEIQFKNKLLEKNNEEKNKLFSIVSHDLRTPIDSITGYLNILSENIIDEGERKEIEGELYAQTRYTSDLLLNLLYWSKTQMNGVVPNLAVVKLVELVDDARNFQMNAAAKKGIKLTYSIDKDIEVIADKDMLKIVLRNVVNNALKFTKTGGEVMIKLNKKGALGEISVKDNGIGMQEDKQKEIFTLKSDSTYGTRDEKGIGLGLMLCKEFMTYQHGDIYFESKVGEGSVFYISLPLAANN